IEPEPSQHGEDTSSRTPFVHPSGPGEQRVAAAPAGEHEQHTAYHETGGDQAGKPCRAELLARHRRKALDVPEHHGAERDERRTGQRITDLYLASPTALSAAPRFASESAMNFEVPTAS